MIRKILIVDDQISILSGMSRALHKHCDFQGEITAVDNGKKALGAISSGFYDVCFLDLNLPDMNGLDVMEQIHSLSPKTKIVIMSAEYLEEDIRYKIDEGAFHFIPKPIELDALKAFIYREALSDENYEYTKGSAIEINSLDKRAAERRADDRTVNYSLSLYYNWELKSSLHADIIDISAGGIGMMTSYRIYPGNILRFDSALENKTGIVKWSVKKDNNYRAGVRFI